ncbi:MAG: nuclear transport factor 2 family protein [Rhizobiaceae bacterium]|nr:nuclear transport factor 2 family protein [Rhizobiaceae bacterium]
MAEPAEAVRRYHDAINRLDYQALDDFFAQDAVYVSNGIGTVSGKEAILASFRAYFAEYPDQVAVDDLIENISAVEARSVWRLAATSARTGQPLIRSGEEIVRLDAEGRIERVYVRDL